jgi:hypothetical protein
MSRVVRNLLSVLMAVIVLVSSNGIVLASHTCLKKSNTTVSLFKSKSCCSKTKKPCESGETKSVKARCCVSSVSYHKVNVNTVLVQRHVFLAQMLAAPVLTILTSQPFSVIDSPINFKPPLLNDGGKDLLKQVSSFRI